ncbi:hypothetical protein BLNAU_9088 [Blattamonas nauphoetae]|uniref:Uncharacterized protein n=1 Tax=Blattamonas nauphoetae TaxID=2049346 RepID=A0ABQ9XWS1_9EUKA|nr:hypothetical protein BLNAU_9088 [Blattamonas nauphoetae]
MNDLRGQTKKSRDSTKQLCADICYRRRDIRPMKESLLIERLKSSPDEISIFLECLDSFPIDSAWNILNILVPSWSPIDGKTDEDVKFLGEFTKKCIDSVLGRSPQPTNHQSGLQCLDVTLGSEESGFTQTGKNYVIRSMLFFISTEAGKLYVPSMPIPLQTSVQVNYYPLSLIPRALPTLLFFSLSEVEEISFMAQSLLMQATHMDGGCFSLLKASLSPSTLLDDLRHIHRSPLYHDDFGRPDFPYMVDFIDTMFPLIQNSKQNPNEVKSSEILLTLLKNFDLPFELDLPEYYPNFLPNTVLDQLLNDLHPSFFPQLLTEFMKMNKQTKITFFLTEANLCTLIDNVDVVSSPELATLLVAFLNSAHKLDFPSSRFTGVTQYNAQPREIRTGLVLAELLLHNIVKAEHIPNCVSALLLHLNSSPNLNYTNTLVHAVYLNIEHLSGSRLSSKRIPSLIRALLDFETALPVISGINQVEIAVRVELCRYRVFKIILVLLNFLELESTQTKKKTCQSSFFDQNSETDDSSSDDEFNHHVYSDTPQDRLHFESNGTVSIIKWSPSRKPSSSQDLRMDLHNLVWPSSISMQQKSFLLEIAPSLISRISERIPHFMDRAWWEGLEEPSDTLSRSDSIMDRSLVMIDLLDAYVCPTVTNIIDSLTVLAPEIQISQLAHLLSPFIWSESESVFWNVRETFISLSKESNQSGFLLGLRVNPLHAHVSPVLSPTDEKKARNRPPPPPPPLTSQPAHQSIAEKVPSPSPALLSRNVSRVHDSKTIPLLKVFVQQGLHFGEVDFSTTMKILNGVDHKSRMAMLTYLVEELADRRTTSLVGIPQVIVGLKSFTPQLLNLILPFSRLLRLSTHVEIAVDEHTPQGPLDFKDLTHLRVVTLSEIAKMIVWMMSTPVERVIDMKIFRQLASLFSSALISSLISLPTLRSKNTTVELPLPVDPFQIGTSVVAADRASVWKTSLLEEGLFDLLGFFFNEGIADCVSFFGFNCTFPINPALTFVPRPAPNNFNTGYRHGRRR